MGRERGGAAWMWGDTDANIGETRCWHMVTSGQAQDTWSVLPSYWLLLQDLTISTFAETGQPWQEPPAWRTQSNCGLWLRLRLWDVFILFWFIINCTVYIRTTGRYSRPLPGGKDKKKASFSSKNIHLWSTLSWNNSIKYLTPGNV